MGSNLGASGPAGGGGIPRTRCSFRSQGVPMVVLCPWVAYPGVYRWWYLVLGPISGCTHGGSWTRGVGSVSSLFQIVVPPNSNSNAEGAQSPTLCLLHNTLGPGQRTRAPYPGPGPRAPAPGPGPLARAPGPSPLPGPRARAAGPGFGHLRARASGPSPGPRTSGRGPAARGSGPASRPGSGAAPVRPVDSIGALWGSGLGVPDNNLDSWNPGVGGTPDQPRDLGNALGIQAVSASSTPLGIGPIFDSLLEPPGPRTSRPEGKGARERLLQAITVEVPYRT